MMHFLKTRRGAVLTAAALGGALVLATGCPSFKVEQIELAQDSVSSLGFTIEATVSVSEEDPAVDDDGNLSGGRGILGIWLPPGWTVDEVRVKGPEDDGFTALTPIEDAEGHFPTTFPHVPGEWFAFVSGCQNLPEGELDYEVEADVSGDGAADQVTLGIAAARFDDGGSQGPVPTEVTVDLAAGTVSVREAPPSPAPSGLDECPSIPYEDAQGDGGCSCVTAGAGSNRAFSLIEVLAKTF